MDDPTATFKFLGLTFDWTTIISTLLAMAIVIIVSIVLTRKLSVKPNKRQNAIEYLLDFTNGIVNGQLTKKQARQFGLFAFTLFFFVIVSNEMGLLIQFKLGDGVGVVGFAEEVGLAAGAWGGTVMLMLGVVGVGVDNAFG